MLRRATAPEEMYRFHRPRGDAAALPLNVAAAPIALHTRPQHTHAEPKISGPDTRRHAVALYRRGRLLKTTRHARHYAADTS